MCAIHKKSRFVTLQALEMLLIIALSIFLDGPIDHLAQRKFMAVSFPFQSENCAVGCQLRLYNM